MILALLGVAALVVCIIFISTRPIGPNPPPSATLSLRAYSQTYGWLTAVNMYRWDDVGNEWTALPSVLFEGDAFTVISNMPLGTYKLRLQWISEVCDKDFTFVAGRTETWDAVLTRSIISPPDGNWVSVKGWALGSDMLGLRDVKITINGTTKTTMWDGYTSDGWNLVLGEAYTVTVVGPTGKTYTSTRTLYAASSPASYYLLATLDSSYSITTVNFISTPPSDFSSEQQ